MEDTQGFIYSPKAWPIAEGDLETRVLNTVHEAHNYEQLNRGINESVKALNKSIAQLVVLAADTDPIQILLNVPPLCESMNVMYVFVPTSLALGRAAGVDRAVVSVAITYRENSAFQPQVEDLRKRLEATYI